MDIHLEQSNSLIQTLIGRLPVGILYCDFDETLTIEGANEGFFRLTGFMEPDLEERFHNSLSAIIHPDDFTKVAEQVARQFLNNEPVSIECRILCSDGSYKQVEYSGRFINDSRSAEKLIGVIVGKAESSDGMNPGAVLAKEPESFLGKHDFGLKDTHIMICEWDIASDTLNYSCNRKGKDGTETVYNQIAAQVSSHKWIHPEDTQVYAELLEKLREGSIYAAAEFRIFNAEEYIWCQVHGVAMCGRQEKPVKALCIIFNIDERKQAMDDLKIRAERDALTGLYNRKETEKQIRAYLEEKPENICAFFMIDTDNFKQINDTNGHMLGDIVLTEMAYGMKKMMRESDVVGRIGGDDFLIFMKNITSREAAVQKAADLTEMFRRLFENEKRSIHVTCSMGVALYPDDGRDFRTLYNYADRALYQAKSQGKDGYVVYDTANSRLPEETGYSSISAAIESQPISLGDSSDLLTYIFKLLCNMEDLEQAVNLSLEVVGKRFDVSRAYIFETNDVGKYYKNTYEWCNEGIEPEIQNLQRLDYYTAGDYRELFGEDSIYYCRNTHLLPPVQRKLFEDQGIRSFLQYALWDKERFAGFIGFDECTGMRLWTKEEVNALSLISELLDTFLQKKKMQEREQKLQDLLRRMIEEEDGSVCVIGSGTYEILYFNSRVKQLMPRFREGALCYETFFYADHPCSFCPLNEDNAACADSLQQNICTSAHAAPIKWSGKYAYLVSFRNSDRTDAVKTAEHTDCQKLHLAAEKSIADCIQWLTTSEYLEDSIEYVLKIILDYYQADRVYIIEADEKKNAGVNTYEVCAKGVIPQIQNLQEVPMEALAFWMKQFGIRDYIRIDDIEELGANRRLEYEILKEQGIKSLMALPLYVKGERKGFLGMDDPKVNKENYFYLEELSYFIENEITKNSMRRRLEKMSFEDALTGLENRNSYMVYSDDFSERMPAPVGVVFMDINGLKKLNTVRGHVYGDMVITHISEIMKQFFPNGRKFRLSGDEFLIVTEAISYDEFSEQLKLMEAKFTLNGESLLSVGTTWSDVNADLTALMNKAERIMQINKQEYYKGYKEIAIEKIPLLKELTDSIANRQYMIYLQPQLNMKTGKIDRAEVLVRCREKDGTISSPVKFIPFLESEGLISNIDFFVMDEVCKLLTKWKGTRFADMQLSLNFSRITMFDNNFFNEFRSVFSRYDLNPQQLELEVTETQETLNKKQMAHLLEELKKHNFNIALDDFGVEYSSYEFLMMADFDILKIDKGIIQKYEEAERGKTLVKHIVDMGHSIGARCCAEGVETREQFGYMKEIGCDYVQGYIVEKPMAVEQFEQKYMFSGENEIF